MNARKIGIVGASAIVTGNMMGSGIALLPASLATIGSITIISWLISIVGALSLAYVFSRLGLVDPRAGGPVAYAKETSSILGYQTGLLYWLANWIGNLAISITGIEYLSYFYPPLKDPMVGGLFVIASIWLFTFINFLGATKIAKIVSVTIVLLLIPVIGTAIFGWTHFSKAQFIQNWNVTNMPGSQAVFSGIVLTIWSFIGIESASVGAGLVNNPKTTIPIATMIGTSIAGLFYIASTTVISGMFPAQEIAQSGKPFGVAFGAIVGDWSQPFVSIFTAIACFASLGSWMMLVGQAGMIAAKQGTLPEIFRKENAKGIPVQGLTITSSLMTLVMVALMIHDHIDHESSTEMFSYIISTAVLVTIIPYFYSCLHLINVDERNKYSTIRLIVTLLGCIFCFIAVAGSKKGELVGTVITSLACFLFYCLNLRTKGIRRENYSYDSPWR